MLRGTAARVGVRTMVGARARMLLRIWMGSIVGAGAKTVLRVGVGFMVGGGVSITIRVGGTFRTLFLTSAMLRLVLHIFKERAR